MSRPTVQYITAPDGLGHALDTVQRMAALARKGSQSLPIRRLATKITAHVPSKDPKGELAAIYKWTRDRIRYRRDPVGIEWVQSPIRTVKERAGDCDDLATLIAALAQSLGHKTRFHTVGKTADRPSHVYAEAFTGSEWIALDPVLEPMQATTAKRTDAGKFNHRAPGPKRVFDGNTGRQIGTMAGTNGPGPGPGGNAIRLWQPTDFERPSLARATPRRIYATRGMAHVKPIRVNVWVNPLDPTDFAGLGSVGELGNIFKSIGKAIGSVAKIAAPIASMVPGIGTAVGAGLSVVGAGADALTKGGKGKSKKGKAITGPQAAAASTSTEHQGAGPTGFGPAPNFGPAIKALARANSQGLQTIAALARVRIAADAASSKDKRQHRASLDTAKIKRSVTRQLKGRLKPAKKGRAMHGLSPKMHFTFGAAQANASTYDEDTAAALAPKVAANIAANKYDYSRALLKQFQAAVGLTADGAYGGTSAGAIRYFTGKAPPRPLFKPLTEQPYAPPAADEPTTRDDAAEPSTPAAETRQDAKEAPPPDATPIPRGKAAPSAKSKAQAAVRAVQIFSDKHKHKPPQVALPAVGKFQALIKGMKQDGLWGWRTRNAVAAVLGVPASTLPPTAWPEPKKKAAAIQTPKKKPAKHAAAKHKAAKHAAAKQKPAKHAATKHAAAKHKQAVKHTKAATKHAQAASKHKKAAKHAAIEQAIADGINDVVTAAKAAGKQAHHRAKAAAHEQTAEHHKAQAIEAGAAAPQSNTGILLAAMWYFSRRRAA